MTLIPRWRQHTPAAFARRWRWLQLDGIGVERVRVEWATPGRGWLTASVLVRFPDGEGPVPVVSAASLWTHRFGGAGRGMFDTWECHPTGDGRGVLIVINWRIS